MAIISNLAWESKHYIGDIATQYLHLPPTTSYPVKITWHERVPSSVEPLCRSHHFSSDNSFATGHYVSVQEFCVRDDFNGVQHNQHLSHVVHSLAMPCYLGNRKGKNKSVSELRKSWEIRKNVVRSQESGDGFIFFIWSTLEHTHTQYRLRTLCKTSVKTTVFNKIWVERYQSLFTSLKHVESALNVLYRSHREQMKANSSRWNGRKEPLRRKGEIIPNLLLISPLIGISV